MTFPAIENHDMLESLCLLITIVLQPFENLSTKVIQATELFNVQVRAHFGHFRSLAMLGGIKDEDGWSEGMKGGLC